jgi:hypothetical protein
MHNSFITGGVNTRSISVADAVTLNSSSYNSPGFILAYSPGNNNTVTLAGANPTQLAGVAFTKPWLYAISVGEVGTFKTLSGGIINVGDTVTSDATSRAITVHPAASGHTEVATLGVAIDSATAAGQYISVRVAFSNVAI